MHQRAWVCALLAGVISVGTTHGFEAEEYEEPAGLSFAVYRGWRGESWSLGFEDGTWLKDTPILGQAFLRAVWLEKPARWYGGLGITLRLMRRGEFAPFVGAGGGFFKEGSGEEKQGPEKIPSAFWVGIAEMGLRIHTRSGGFWDFVFHYVWNSEWSELEYPAVGIGRGQLW